jgi:hypothetical protein
VQDFAGAILTQAARRLPIDRGNPPETIRHLDRAR